MQLNPHSNCWLALIQLNPHNNCGFDVCFHINWMIIALNDVWLQPMITACDFWHVAFALRLRIAISESERRSDAHMWMLAHTVAHTHAPCLFLGKCAYAFGGKCACAFGSVCLSASVHICLVVFVCRCVFESKCVWQCVCGKCVYAFSSVCCIVVC